jgi:putative chitinase
VSINIFNLKQKKEPQVSFSFAFTPEKLKACVPQNTHITDWYNVMCTTLPEYDITTWQRVAQWIAQISHESGDFRITSENLNYKTTALTAMFGNRISVSDANKHGRDDAKGQKANPEAIANCIYGGDWGKKNLGNTQVGDGWKFRGRGLVQVTGRANYTACSKALYGDEQILLKEPEILSEQDGAIRSACWFWNSRKINSPADKEDTLAVTKLINSGTNGLEDRISKYNLAKSILRS